MLCLGQAVLGSEAGACASSRAGMRMRVNFEAMHDVRQALGSRSQIRDGQHESTAGRLLAGSESTYSLSYLNLLPHQATVSC